ncbi:hypothetical protein AURDEDRAFT_159221 [Auricularia subglabra TFB-10046 SS5]|nr:hypothetical protein AURDEDRAFT_159221 [Auricularia subglabra TFB-10046 SS5]
MSAERHHARIAPKPDESRTPLTSLPGLSSPQDADPARPRRLPTSSRCSAATRSTRGASFCRSRAARPLPPAVGAQRISQDLDRVAELLSVARGAHPVAKSTRHREAVARPLIDNVVKALRDDPEINIGDRDAMVADAGIKTFRDVLSKKPDAALRRSSRPAERLQVPSLRRLDLVHTAPTSDDGPAALCPLLPEFPQLQQLDVFKVIAQLYPTVSMLHVQCRNRPTLESMARTLQRIHAVPLASCLEVADTRTSSMVIMRQFRLRRFATK